SALSARGWPSPRTSGHCGVDRKGAALDRDAGHGRGCAAERPCAGLLLGQQHERVVGTLGQRPEPVLLVTKEALERLLLRGLVDPLVGPLQPALELLGEVRITHEGAAVDEVLPQVADRALDLALGLGPAGTAGPRPEAPV